MLIRIGLIVLIFTCVHTIDESANNLADKAVSKDVLPKKETVVGESEGGIVKEDPSKIEAPHISDPNVPDKSIKTVHDNATAQTNGSTLATQVVTNSTIVKANVTVNATVDSTASESLVNKPGVVKRGLIVFGGFSLLAAAYFLFYRRKRKNYDSNAHNNGDANQFRYGVLQSDDRRDNLELSQIPLTMESDDEEEDLEIFDLEQKKKSLSYVSLEVNDEDIVLNSSKDESKNNLLLDIEDGSSDTLINWSSTGTYMSWDTEIYEAAYSTTDEIILFLNKQVFECRYFKMENYTLKKMSKIIIATKKAWYLCLSHS